MIATPAKAPSKPILPRRARMIEHMRTACLSERLLQGDVGHTWVHVEHNDNLSSDQIFGMGANDGHMYETKQDFENCPRPADRVAIGCSKCSKSCTPGIGSS